MTYPTTSPELTLDFAKAERLDPRVTFSRSSSATYVGYDGLIKTAPADVARFEYDANGKCLGLLVEESRTNYTPNSLCSTANWTINGLVVTDNAGTAPDGTTTATFVTPDTGSLSITSPFRNLPSAGPWTNSVFVKPDGITTFDLNVVNYNETSNQTVTFDTTQSGVNGAGITPYYQNTANYLGAEMKHYPNGWVKLSISVNIVGPDLNGVWQLKCTGDATSSFYVWHWQQEEGSFPTSLIPTAGSTVTRAADVASMTASPYLYGTFYAKYKHFPGNSSARQIFAVGNSNAYNAFVCRTTATGQADIVLPGVAGLTTTANSDTSDFNTVATARVIGDYAICLNGGTVATTTSSNDQTNNSVITFMYGSVGAVSGGHISRLTFYPERVSDESLEALTA